MGEGKSYQRVVIVKEFAVRPPLNDDEEMTIIRASKVDITANGDAVFYDEHGVSLFLARGQWEIVERLSS